MDSSSGGKRVLPGSKKPKGAKIAAISAVTAVALAAGAYVGLCAYVSGSGRILNNTTASMGVDLSGMTRQEAVSALETASRREYTDGQSIRVSCAGAPGAEVEVPGGLVQVDAAAVADAALAHGRESGFLGMGVSWLSAQFGGTSLEAEPQPVPDAEKIFTDIANDFNASIGSTLAETSYQVTDDALVLTKGVSGLSVSVDDVREKLLDAAVNGKDSVLLNPQTALPPEPDFEAILREVSVASADAYLDKETKQIVPSVTGVSFDVAAARESLARTEEGGVCRVPLILEEPGITTEKLEQNLFKDVLAETKTWCSGPASRRANIDLACSFVSGTILLPGEVFSYTEHCGPYTVSNGYGKATAYVQGKSVDTTAGGICQLSSTLYWATLVANLETVERSQHAYNTGYLPIVGTDATVYDSSPDFKFKNSTEYPIKLECYRDKNNNLHVTILGTSNGIHGEPYSVVLGTEAAKTVYEANDARVAPGGEPVRDSERTAYNGITVEVYLKLVDENGNVIDTQFLHRDKYRSRNGVYFYNSADAARLGIDPSTGLRNLTPVVPSADPSAEPSSDPSADPVPTGTADPNVTPTPGTDPTPVPPATDPVSPTPPAEGEVTPPVSEPPVDPQEPVPPPSQDVPEGIPIITPTPDVILPPEPTPTPVPVVPEVPEAPEATETPWPL